MNTLLTFPKKVKETHREYAYRILRYNIMMLNLYPGETLNEALISDQLSVSRTPVHEALLLLQNQKLTTVVPQSGTHVTLISLKNVNEGLFFRQTLEPPIYRQIASTIPNNYLMEMQKILETTKEIVSNPLDKSEHDMLIQLDNRFHQLAYYAAQKNIIWESVQSVCSHYDRIRYQGYISGEDDPIRVYEEHKRLFDYLIVGGSPDFDLDEFYTQHISHYKKYFPQFYYEHSEYFSTE